MAAGRLLTPALHVIASLVCLALLLFVSATGLGPLPPLGPTFVPGTGVWTAGADVQLPRAETIHGAGLQRAARVTFESNGVAHLQAATDTDLYWAIGYLHARFRLFQMDLLRRQGESRLSQIVGPDALPVDRFEARLGLLRTAQAEWAAMPRSGEAAGALQAYAQGVNARIREDEAQSNLPLLFKMLDYHPSPWTPIDSLVIQGDMAQTLDFTDDPLDYAVYARTLGYTRTMQWFPVLPANDPHGYDPGPYASLGLQPLLPQQGAATADSGAVAELLDSFGRLPAYVLHHGANSNNWAVGGAKTASGKALLAGDPHLQQTLPAIWYQLEANSPGYHFSGVSIPGLPVILIGHNRDIAWSLTNVQNQATLFYRERTDRAHPGQYYWKGAWRKMATLTYDIPVEGGPTDHLTVQLTVHGPIMEDARVSGQAISVLWMGGLPSPDAEAMLKILRASDFTAFRNALRLWHAPSQNFVYADRRGNVGLISAGYYPIVRRGTPWLPLPGDGSADVVGTIPFDAIPQVYNPPSHYVFSANQRPVGDSYPYYIGTSKDFFDNGYRAAEIETFLARHGRLTVRDMEQLQNDTHDYLAGLIVPRLLSALSGRRLGARERQALLVLQRWNGNMDVASPGATIWWQFWTSYLLKTFKPWWDFYKVPYRTFASLAIGPGQVALVEDLESWTLHDPTNGAFTPPRSRRRSANDVMVAAFTDAVSVLSKQLGGNPAGWRWGHIHQREFISLAQIPSLGYGPRAGSGDPWTVDAADGFPIATAGPSWRFIMDWGTGGALGVYPGGQSENPVSDWYETGIDAWWQGKYFPMIDAAAARRQAGSVTWTLLP